jgi:hypothetical protein
MLAALAVGGVADVELSHWHDADPPLLRHDSRDLVERMLQLRPFEGSRWRLIAIRSVVFGPARFNHGLRSTGCKAKVHFSAFVRLVQWLWESASDGHETHIRSDKHGGRHFYYEPLVDAFPDCWIDRGVEGPDRSRYTMRAGERRLELDIRPKADADDGLVAIASMVSKAVREWWMSAFNAHWTARIDGLKPTAGYPGDSARFRAAIEPHCEARGLSPDLWWREK